MIAALKQQAGIHSDIVGEVLDAVAESIKADEDLEIYTSGTNNIFRYPELADQQKASQLINAFEEKETLSELVLETLADENNTGIQIYIGEETPMQGMKDCSVVTATYELEEGTTLRAIPRLQEATSQAWVMLPSSEAKAVSRKTLL